MYLDWGDRDIRMISSQLIVFSICCKIWALCLFDNYRYLCAETEQDMLKIMAAIVKAKVCLIVSSLKHINVLIHHVEHKMPSCHYLWQDLRKGTTLCNFECIDFKAAYLRNTVCDINETWVFLYRGRCCSNKPEKKPFSQTTMTIWGEVNAIVDRGNFLKMALLPKHVTW